MTNMAPFLSEGKIRALIIVLIWGIVISLASSLPYLWGFLRNDDKFVYLGRSIVNNADTSIFTSHIESVKDGSLLLPNLFTSYPRDTYFIKPLYMFLGIVAKLFSFNSMLIYQVSRIFLIVIFVYVLWLFLGFFLKDFNKRFLSLVVITTSSGLGFLVKQFLPASIDLWVPEANTFSSLMEAPHFIWSQICVLITMISLLKFHSRPRYFHLFYGSIFTSLVILEHPYLIPFLLLLLAIFLISISNTFSSYLKNFVWSLGLPLLATAFMYVYYKSSLGFELYSKQVNLPTPNLVEVAFGFGLLLPLAIFGFFKSEVGKIRIYLLVLWALLLFVLIYIPFSFQRRLLETLHIPIAFFASLAILHFLTYKRRVARLLVACLILALASTNIYLVTNAFRIISADTDVDYHHHIYREDFEGLIWLKNNSAPNDLVLANFIYSNIIPGITGRYVYSGHLFNTVNARERSDEVRRFMNGTSIERADFIQRNKPRFIFFGKVDPYSQYKDMLIDEGFIRVWEKGGVIVLEIKTS